MSLVEMGNIIASYFGTTFDFHNFVTNIAAKVRPTFPVCVLRKAPTTTALSSGSRT